MQKNDPILIPTPRIYLPVHSTNPLRAAPPQTPTYHDPPISLPTFAHPCAMSPPAPPPPVSRLFQPYQQPDCRHSLFHTWQCLAVQVAEEWSSSSSSSNSSGSIAITIAR
jgi:hypothetical protein